MCAPLSEILDESPGTVGQNGGFWVRLGGWERKYTDLWMATGDGPFAPGPRTSRLGRYRNLRHCRTLVDYLAGELAVLPPERSAQFAWRQRVKSEIQRFGEERFDWPRSYRDLLVSEEFFDSTNQFTRWARQFEPRISVSDLGQALRNVWIVNSLQMLLDREVLLSRATFAYSMLYPYTDNFLDDPNIISGQKLSLSRNLGRWLSGERAKPENLHEGAIRRLVSMIEDQFDRAESPGVFASVQAIHSAQVDSLRQSRTLSRLRESEVLALSIRKGGASVLADGYLAAGQLEPAEEDFCYGYGVFLQFLDDLQDVQEDLECGHQTLFTRAAGSGPLDRITSRLFHFMHSVVGGAQRFSDKRFQPQRDLILHNCVHLLVTAIAESPKLYSRRFRRRLQGRWVLGLGSMRGLRSRSQKRFCRALESLRQLRRVDCVFDLF